MGIAEQALFNRFLYLDSKTWNQDPYAKEYKPLYAEMDEIERELKIVHKLAVKWTDDKCYVLVPAKPEDEEPLQIVISKTRKTHTKHNNRYVQRKQLDGQNKPYWVVIDLQTEEEQGPFYVQYEASKLAERLNKDIRRRNAGAKKRVRLDFGKGKQRRLA